MWHLQLSTCTNICFIQKFCSVFEQNKNGSKCELHENTMLSS